MITIRGEKKLKLHMSAVAGRVTLLFQFYIKVYLHEREKCIKNRDHIQIKCKYRKETGAGEFPQQPARQATSNCEQPYCNLQPIQTKKKILYFIKILE